MQLRDPEVQYVHFRDYSARRFDTIEENLGLVMNASVTNYTSSPIKVLDHHGEIHVVNPEVGSTFSELDGHVVITEWVRAQCTLNLDRYKIVKRIAIYTVHDFCHKAKYDPISNTVIAHQRAVDLVHPYAQKASDDYLSNIHDEILGQFRKPPYAIVCNDPTGQLQTLYCVINNNLCELEVTNHQEEEARCSIFASIPADNGSYSVEQVDLDAIKRGECKFSLAEGKVIFIGVNKTQVLNSATAYLLSVQMSKDTQDLKKEYENSIKELEVGYKLELKNLKAEWLDKEAALKRDLIRTTEELERYRADEEYFRKSVLYQQKMKENELSLLSVLGKSLATIIPAILTIMVALKK